MAKLRLVDLKQIQKALSELLPPGGYSKFLRPETDAELLNRLSKKYPAIINKKTAGEDRMKLRQVLEDRAREAPTKQNIQALEDFKKEFYGLKDSDVVEKSFEPKSKILTKEQMREKRAADKAKIAADKTPVLSADDLKRAASVAALAGGGMAASSLMPEEAEASPLSTAKKSALELFHATRGPFVGEKLKPGADKLIHFGTKEQAADRFAELNRIKKTSPGAQTLPILADIKNPLELSDLSDWSASKIFRDMKKRGVINEKQAQEIIDRSRATGKEIGNDVNKDVLLDYIQKDLGYDAIKYKNIYEAAEADKIAAAAKINPDMGKIPELRSQKASLEAQLLDESGKVKPSSRETDKIHDQINKIDKQLRPLQNKLQSAFEQGADYSYAVPEKHGGILKSKLSGTPLAIGAAIGAGMLASPSARADEGPSVSQSSPEFSSSKTSNNVENAVTEAMSKYGTYDIPKGIEKAFEGIDKYTGRPARAAALSALQGKNPLTGAIESISKDKDVEGSEVARQFLKNSEELSGMRLRRPVDPRLEQLTELGVEIEGKKPEEYLPSNEFPAEGPLGFASNMLLDPTNLMGVGLGTKVGKGFSKLRNVMK